MSYAVAIKKLDVCRNQKLEKLYFPGIKSASLIIEFETGNNQCVYNHENDYSTYKRRVSNLVFRTYLYNVNVVKEKIRSDN